MWWAGICLDARKIRPVTSIQTWNEDDALLLLAPFFVVAFNLQSTARANIRVFGPYVMGELPQCSLTRRGANVLLLPRVPVPSALRT
jgi:hypothetical protein